MSSFRNQTDALFRHFVCHMRQSLLVIEDLTFFRCNHPRDRFEHSRLSCSVCTNDRDDLSIIDADTCITQGGNVSIVHTQMVDFKHLHPPFPNTPQ